MQKGKITRDIANKIFNLNMKFKTFQMPNNGKLEYTLWENVNLIYEKNISALYFHPNKASVGW